MSDQFQPVHYQDENGHTVCLAHLRVLITKDTDGWFAQGIDIDYAASGESMIDVKDRFQAGLRDTIEAHLRQFGTIEGLLEYAPEEEWKKLKPSTQFDFTTVISFHDIPGWEQDMDQLPFEGIAYLAAREAA